MSKPALSEREAAARRAAALILWAACPGESLQNAAALMLAASKVWPTPPLTTGDLLDAPSPALWARIEAEIAIVKGTTDHV